MVSNNQNKQKIFLLITIIALFGSNVFSYSSISDSSIDTLTQTHEVSAGLKILIYYDGFAHSSPSKFKEVYNISGGEVVISTDYDFSTQLLSDNFDAILLSNINEMSDANLTAIKTWYEVGQRLLWVSGDSDYGGYYNASSFANKLLNLISSQLRVDAGAVADYESNDNAAYRVIANETGLSSPLVDYVTSGFQIAPFHGPTSVFGWNYSSDFGVDLRFNDLPNVDVIVTSSSAAIALDQDLSVSVYDFYEYRSNITGLYPMLVSEKFNDSYVVVSGEVIFDDYKFMYGDLTEKTLIPHQGMRLVDNMISWVFSEDFQTHPKVQIVVEGTLTTVTQIWTPPDENLTLPVTSEDTKTSTSSNTTSDTGVFVTSEENTTNSPDISSKPPALTENLSFPIVSIGIIALIRRRRK